MQRILFALVLSVLAGSAIAGSATGTYVGNSPNAAYLVDIVQAGNQLTGRYEQYDQRGDHGKGADETFTFTAVIDGTHFAGQIRSSFPLSSPIPVSGEVAASTFRLNGDASFHLALTRGDQHVFQQQVAALQNNASIAQRVATVSDLTVRMQSFNEREHRATSGFPSLEQKVVDVTAKMQAELARERSIIGGGQRSGQRAEISGNIHQLSGDAFAAKGEVSSTFDELLGRLKPLKAESIEATKICEPVLRLDIGTPLHEACRHFEFEASVFKQGIEETRGAFDHFKTVWQREGAAQEGIARSSDAAIR